MSRAWMRRNCQIYAGVDAQVEVEPMHYRIRLRSILRGFSRGSDFATMNTVCLDFAMYLTCDSKPFFSTSMTI